MLDWKKTFDSVTHEILVQILDHCGIDGKAFNLFSLYFSSFQNSSTLPIRCGVLHTVPVQGSVLKSLVFFLYINDLTNSINTTPRLFVL